MEKSTYGVCGARLVRTRSDPFEPVRAVSEKVPRNATVSAVGTLAGLTHTTLSLTTLTVHSPQPLQLGLGLGLGLGFGSRSGSQSGTHTGWWCMIVGSGPVGSSDQYMIAGHQY